MLEPPSLSKLRQVAAATAHGGSALLLAAIALFRLPPRKLHVAKIQFRPPARIRSASPLRIWQPSMNQMYRCRRGNFLSKQHR